MKLPPYATKSDVRIELIPLIDVIFCILTFFILAAVTLTRQTAINVDLPTASSGTAQMREMLVVSVDQIGQTYIDQTPVSRDQLYQELITYRQASPDGLIVLYASRLSTYNDVVQVLDLLRSVGGNQVALATIPEDGQASPQFPSLTPQLDDPLNPANPFGNPNPADPFNPNQPLFPGTDPFPTQPSPGNDFFNPVPLPSPNAPE